MKIDFFTKNLDETFYRQMIQQYIADHIKQSMSAYRKYESYHNEWTIEIYPVEAWGGMLEGGVSVGTTHPGIPHGVTGKGLVKVYVHDDDDMGLKAIQNFAPIFHEVAHMLMIMIMPGIRGTFRNDDLSGNKVGRQANVSTQEVHDRQMEGNTYQVTAYVNFGNWIVRKWRPFTAIGINLRDFISNHS
jgi:hypothetical protein